MPGPPKNQSDALDNLTAVISNGQVISTHPSNELLEGRGAKAKVQDSPVVLGSKMLRSRQGDKTGREKAV